MIKLNDNNLDVNYFNLNIELFIAIYYIYWKKLADV